MFVSIISSGVTERSSINLLHPLEKMIKDLFDPQCFLDKIPNERFRFLLDKLIKCCSHCKFKTNNYELLIMKNDVLRCYTLTQKSKLILVFPILVKQLQLDITYEKIKGNELYIELKDDKNIWDIINDRLN